QLAAGQEADAVKAEARLVRRIMAEKDASLRSGLVYYLLNTPCSLETARALSKLTAAELAKGRTVLALHDHGGALWRGGRHDEAEKLFNESVKVDGKRGFIGTDVYLSLALRRRGQHAQAEKLLAGLKAWRARQSFSSWHLRALWDGLLREASQPPR